MFDLDQFIADCRAALGADRSHKLVREIVARGVSNPTELLRGLGEPKRAQLQKLYHAPDLTILNVIWASTMTIMPHDHRMWAVIHRTGRQHLWPRVKGDPDGKVEAPGARALCLGDAEPLGSRTRAASAAVPPGSFGWKRRSTALTRSTTTRCEKGLVM
jgi:predicted metal-dependent enzyme (double-stranded beta helix superfamily)